MKLYSNAAKKSFINSCSKISLLKTFAALLSVIMVLGLFSPSIAALEIDDIRLNTATPDEAIAAIGANKYTIPNVPYLDQNELPTGCETVSGVMLLNYYGMNISAKSFANNYLIKESLSYDNYGNLWGPDPDSAFVGNPESYSSYGIYAPAMAKSMNKYLKAINAPYEAVAIRGLSLQQVCSTYIDNNRPVMVWATMYMVASYKTTLWYINYLDENSSMKKGDSFRWTAEEHCLLLVGYDSNNYYFNDPLTDAYYAYSKSVVEKRYAELNKSIVILEPHYTSISANCTDESGNALKDTSVSFYDAATDKLIETVTTDDAGRISTSKSFSPGTYRVSIVPPASYEFAAAPQTIVITMDNVDKEVEFSIKCQHKKGYIIAEAFDINDNPIEGIIFSVYDKDNQLVANLAPTSKDGYTISEGGYQNPSIPYGAYTVKIENMASTSLHPLENEWEIELAEGMIHTGHVEATFVGTLMYGDIDLSGSINVKDSTAIQKHVALLNPLSNIALSVSDVNMDESIDIQDATIIQKHIAKIHTESRVETLLYR